MASRQDARKHYDRLRNGIPDNYLESFFFEQSANVEAFYKVRAVYTKSLALICVYGYLLGIGDRHLDNILVDEKRLVLCGLYAIILISI